jgi:hypothetical protein
MLLASILAFLFFLGVLCASAVKGFDLNAVNNRNAARPFGSLLYSLRRQY